MSAPQSLKQLSAAIARHRAELGPKARVCFLLQPGGAAGAYQAGALLALAGRGLWPDLIVGTSVGALNGLGLMLDALAPVAGHAWPPTRLGRLWRRLSHRQRGAALLLDKPCLVGWMSGRPDWNRHLLGSVATHAAHLGEDWAALQGGVFSAKPLKRVLTAAIAEALGEAGCTAQRAGHALTQAWAAADAAGRRPPTLVVTGTRVGTHAAVPFVLGDPEVAHRLFDQHWPVAMLGHEALVGEAVVDTFLASCAIPGVFPPVLLPIPGMSAPFRTYVDGAIAHSEPFHLAIDAGATLIVSLEVSSRRSGPPAHPAVPFPVVAAETFLTVQDRYYATDMREVARWNRQAAHREAPGKQLVKVYRLAPHRREIGLLEFDGRWEDGQLVCSLYDWYMAGYADAGGSHPRAWETYLKGRERHGDTGWALQPRPHAGFWDATFQPLASALAEAPEAESPLPARSGT